jgi:hypothetical protein
MARQHTTDQRLFVRPSIIGFLDAHGHVHLCTAACYNDGKHDPDDPCGGRNALLGFHAALQNAADHASQWAHDWSLNHNGLIIQRIYLPNEAFDPRQADFTRPCEH